MPGYVISWYLAEMKIHAEAMKRRIWVYDLFWKNLMLRRCCLMFFICMYESYVETLWWKVS